MHSSATSRAESREPDEPGAGDATATQHRALVSEQKWPRLVLGDHGFLQKYGSRLSTKEIQSRMRLGIDRGVGLAAGDRRCLTLATRVARPNGFVLYHTDGRFLASYRRCHFGRTMATLGNTMKLTHPQFLESDPIMGAFLTRYGDFRPYTLAEPLQLDEDAFARDVDVVKRHTPRAVSVGGDYLDALLSLGRIDLVVDCFRQWSSVCEPMGASLIFTTYLAGVCDLESLRSVAEFVSGLMVPLNVAGLGMLPDRETVTDRLTQVGRPVIAMHALGSGALHPEKALPPLFEMPFVRGAVVGASSPEHIALVAALVPEADE
jgi:hypothetical protein